MSIEPPRFDCLDGRPRPFMLASGEAAGLDLHVQGKVEPGHGHASGRNPASRYVGGTIRRQYPHFKALGLDLGHCYPGTINVSIAPRTYRILTPAHIFYQVRWFPGRQPENFSFCHCRLVYGALAVDGYVYYPDPVTKTRHFDNPAHLQIIAPFIPGIRPGCLVEVLLNSGEIAIVGG